MITKSRRLLFGIYPGGFVTPELAGPPDDPDQINRALHYLQGAPGRPFLVRAYCAFTEPGQEDRRPLAQTPAGFERLLPDRRALDLVALYQSASGDVEAYCRFLTELIDHYGPRVARLQVCEEPNVTTDPTLDGYYPNVREATITGVSTAKQHADQLGHTHIQIGCNTTPLFGPAAGFLNELAEAGGERFVSDLDYLGLDFFPDVFRPVSDIGTTVEQLLIAHRDLMTSAGLEDLPLVITEHGWPTGPDRSAERQARVLGTVIDATARNAAELKINGYTHFSLRDQDSSSDNRYHRFGLTTDDYTPKPALHTYRDLIDQHSI